MIIDNDVRDVALLFGEDATLLQAIVNAEGDILKAVQCSVPTIETRRQALEVTCRTLNHKRRDYLTKQRLMGDFLAYFASKWAPRGAANDPHDLNANWLRNVGRLAGIAVVLLGMLVARPASAQTAVAPVPDAVSYATAFVNPTLAVIDAWRGPDRACHLAQFALREGIGNLLTLSLKHYLPSERPCAGCAPDGFPSGHTMNSIVGVSSHWAIGLGFAIETGGLRMAAHRHTLPQILAGAAVGLGAEWSGKLLRCP